MPARRSSPPALAHCRYLGHGGTRALQEYGTHVLQVTVTRAHDLVGGLHPCISRHSVSNRPSLRFYVYVSTSAETAETNWIASSKRHDDFRGRAMRLRKEIT